MEDDPGSPAHHLSTRRRARRPAVALVALGSALCLAVGIGWAATRSDPPAATAEAGTAAPVTPDAQAVQTILAGRARAVRERDRRAFLATVFTAPPAFQAAQRQLFDNLTRLPLETWHEELDSALPAASGATGATLKVSLRYKLRGFDRAEVARTSYLTVARRGTDWLISGDGTGNGLRDDAEIWDSGPLTVVHGKSTLVIGATPNGLREIAATLDTAAPAVSRVVGSAWARRAVALVPATPQQAAALVGRQQSLQDIAALATVTPGARGEDRIVVSPTTFAELNRLGREVVLTHELTHVATGGARDGRTPLWLIEGLADYVGYKDAKVSVRSAARELHREVKAGRLPAHLPTRDDFTAGSARMPQVYEEAWLACRMIADRYGEAALVDLYRTAGRQPEVTAVRNVLGVDLRGFTALWRTHLKKELQ